MSAHTHMSRTICDTVSHADVPSLKSTLHLVPPPRVRVHFLLMEHQLCPFTSDESWHPAEMSVWMSGRDFGTRVHTTAPKVWGCGWKKATSDTQANWTIKPPVILIKFIFNQDYFRLLYFTINHKYRHYYSIIYAVCLDHIFCCKYCLKFHVEYILHVKTNYYFFVGTGTVSPRTKGLGPPLPAETFKRRRWGLNICLKY